MAGFTSEEYTDMLVVYGMADCNGREARRIYQERYPNRRVPNHQTFGSTYRRLRETGNLNLREPAVNRFQPNLAAEERILAEFEEDPTRSVRTVARTLGLSVWKVWSVLRENGRHPFRYTPVQGFFLDPDFEEEPSDEEEEEEDEEEEVPALVPAKNKRKLENSNDSSSSKKAKNESKKAAAATEESSDESDDEDQLQRLLDGDDLDTDDNDDSFKVNTSAEADSDEEESEEDEDEEAEEEDGSEDEAETTLDTSKEEKVDLSKLSKSARRRLKKRLQLQGKDAPQVNGVEKSKKEKQDGQQKGDKKKESKKETGAGDAQPVEKKEKKQLSGGVQIEDMKVGSGQAAKPGKTVLVYYEGRLKQNNKMFDHCVKGPGFKFRLGGKEVISGWDTGIAGMKVGGKRKIICPPNMAYGAKGSPPVIPPNSTLVFEVELKNIK